MLFQRLLADLRLCLLLVGVPLQAVKVEALDVLEDVVVEVAHQRQSACWRVINVELAVYYLDLVGKFLLDDWFVELAEFFKVLTDKQLFILAI